MKKLFLCMVLWASVIVFPAPSIAEININIGIALPPPVVFATPPDVIVLPDTNDVYAVPGVDIDLFFWSGWWWRLWEGRWYRSHYYDRGWAYYNRAPSFYFDVDPGWRRYYRDHDWRGHRWDYERIPDRQLQQNWRRWHNDRHWERQRTWGVQQYHPQPQKQREELRRQRQEQYHQRPEVQKHMREQQRKPEVRQPQKQQPQKQQPHYQPQKQQPHYQPQKQEQRQHESRGQQERGKSEHEKSRENRDQGDERHER
ncbi:MAG: hypothetical protein M0Z60_03080 [Nitrospiraceae bacterium]|nr:hypothetical protein [Nitrospiraceae bacterium]